MKLDAKDFIYLNKKKLNVNKFESFFYGITYHDTYNGICDNMQTKFNAREKRILFMLLRKKKIKLIQIVDYELKRK